MPHVKISTSTIVKFFLVPLAGFLLWDNKDMLFSIFIAFILTSALGPMVNYLHHKKNFNRPIATILVYTLFISFLVLLVGTIIPPIVRETVIFIQQLPETLTDLDPNILKSIRIQEISQYIPDLTNQLIYIASNVFSNTIFVVTTLVFGFYMLVNENLLRDLLGGYVSEDRLVHVEYVLARAKTRLSSWFWGELTLMLSIGIASYIGFSIIGLKHALPLAVLAGLLEAIPNVGPLVAAIPAGLIGFTQTPVVGVATLAWTFIIQQLESNLLVPYVMKRAVGINPVITMICVLLGLRFAGPLGMLLAIPIYLCVETFFLDHLKREDVATKITIHGSSKQKKVRDEEKRR